MALNFHNHSIKLKVLLPTSVILFAILMMYSIVFSILFISVKNDAFNDHNILTQITEQIYSIRMKGDNVPTEQLDKLKQLASNYLDRVIEVDGKEEEEEFAAAQAINNNSKKYIQAYHLWQVQHSITQAHELPKTLISLESKLLDSIKMAKEIVQEEAEEDLESLLQYEIISSIIIYFIILIFVAYGIKLVIFPLERLRREINIFNGDSPTQAPVKVRGDEIKLLYDAFKSMRTDIINNQKLLETAVEKAERANAVKTEFLANISHELRTPMLGILGFAELGITKIDTADKAKLLKYYDRIHTSGSRLLLLLNNLLDLAKLEANQMAFDIKENDLEEVLNEVIIELAPLTENKEIKLEITNKSNDLLAEFDNHRIHQILYNLLSNAIKFSPNKGIIKILFVEYSIHINDVEVPAIKFMITDQGIGVPDTELNTIFEKFSQSSRTNTGAGGTGLGLSISKDICNYHHGKIWAENLQKPKQGAQFTFIIPKTFVTN